MPNNKSIQLLRSRTASNSNVQNTVLLDGQPFFDITQNKLYVGHDNLKISQLSPVGYETDIPVAYADTRGTTYVSLTGYASNGNSKGSINSTQAMFTIGQTHIITVNADGYISGNNYAADDYISVIAQPGLSYQGQSFIFTAALISPKRLNTGGDAPHLTAAIGGGDGGPSSEVWVYIDDIPAFSSVSGFLLTLFGTPVQKGGVNKELWYQRLGGFSKLFEPIGGNI